MHLHERGEGVSERAAPAAADAIGREQTFGLRRRSKHGRERA